MKRSCMYHCMYVYHIYLNQHLEGGNWKEYF